MKRRSHDAGNEAVKIEADCQSQLNQRPRSGHLRSVAEHLGQQDCDAGQRPARYSSFAVRGGRRGHDVSILITGGHGDGRCFGVSPRTNVSMMRRREPQHGHGGRSSEPSTVFASSAGSTGIAPSSLRAVSMFSARRPVASSVQAQEARIAALGRLVGKLALENEFLKGASRDALRPRSETRCVVAGPVASRSQKDAG